jgi:release factor glutamine methyltransferase
VAAEAPVTAPRPEETAAATVGRRLREGIARLAAAGVSTPRLDAEILLAEALDPGVADRARLIIDRDEPVPGPGAARFEEMLARRAAREPVAYILGRREFRRITLMVDRRVLIPRPETELLVEVGLELAPADELAAGGAVLDVGTGSGAVALALASERPDLRVRGIDVSPEAVAVARENARALGLSLEFSVADLFDGEPCDAVLANLPYVPRADARGLAPEITRYEPALALYGGADGLGVVRRLIERLRPVESVRLVGLEIGWGQGEATATLLARAGWSSVEVRPDLSGIPRVVVGRR